MSSSRPQKTSLLTAEDLPHLQHMGRRERRAAETRLRLFRCALQLFAERGFPNVTVEDITEAADVGKGTFFNYFETKEHVLSVVAEIQLGKVREAVEQSKHEALPVQKVLKRLFERLVEEPGRSPELARALLSSLLASPRVREAMSQNFAHGRRIFSEIVETGQKNGEIDPKLKPEQVAMQLQQTLLGTVLLWSLHGEPKLQTTSDASFRYFWRSIAAAEEV